jgi:hypothetical protein
MDETSDSDVSAMLAGGMKLAQAAEESISDLFDMKRGRVSFGEAVREKCGGDYDMFACMGRRVARSISIHSLCKITSTVGEGRKCAAPAADIRELESDKEKRCGALIRIISQTWSRYVVNLPWISPTLRHH